MHLPQVPMNRICVIKATIVRLVPKAEKQTYVLKGPLEAFQGVVPLTIVVYVPLVTIVRIRPWSHSFAQSVTTAQSVSSRLSLVRLVNSVHHKD